MGATLFSEIHIITSRMGYTKTCVVVVVAFLALFGTLNAEELGKDSLVVVTCGSCPTKDSKELIGVLGGSLTVSYNIKDITKVQLLQIMFDDDMIVVTYAQSKFKVKHNKVKDKRLLVPQYIKDVKEMNVVVNVTLNQLSMSDADKLFKYSLTNKDLDEIKGQNGIAIQDPCATKDDGVHATKDVFQYMICKHKRASYHSCGNKLFDPCKKRCVSAWEVSPKTLCKCRENGNSMHPWNCHKYITCSNGYQYLFNCSRPGLVYDPAVDHCVHPDERPCVQAQGGPCTSIYAKDRSFDCWKSCGTTGGRCSACGEGGYCCRQGWTDCPSVMSSISTHGYHTCIVCKH